MRAKYGEKLRRFIKHETSISHLLDLGEMPLFDATTYTNILIYKKQEPEISQEFIIQEEPFFEAPTDIAQDTILQQQLSDDNYNLESNPLFWQIKKKIDKIGTPLKQWDIKINYGIKTGFNDAFIIDNETKEKLVKQNFKSLEILKPILRGRDIKKWHSDWQGKWLIFTRLGIDIEQYPAIKKYLLNYEKELNNRAGPQKWYELQGGASTIIKISSKKKLFIPLLKTIMLSLMIKVIFITMIKVFI